MKKMAFIFPGQGAQSVGMGKDLYENFESAKDVFEKANKVLAKDIKKLCFEGPDEDLKQTINTQPAILTMSIAALEALKSKLAIKPSIVAGHSLGEYGALYEAGIIDLETALKLISKRAELMSENKGGSMAAVLGCESVKLDECIFKAKKEGYVAIANYNSPDQIVITGENSGVKKASELLTQVGVKRVIPLAVSGGFHSELMKTAGEKFSNYIEKVSINDAKIPVITNVDAEITTSADDFKLKMPKQIYSSVHWTQTIQKMIEEGVDTFIEIGPGKVLAGLNRKINPTVTTYNVFDKASLDACVEAINLQLV